MRGIIISTQCENCSFDVVFKLLKQELERRGITVLKKIMCGADIDIIDVNLYLTTCTEFGANVVRGDSPYKLVNEDVRSDATLITTSEYNRRLFYKYFKHVEVVPHFYDRKALKFENHRPRQRARPIIIAHNDALNHKRLDVARKVPGIIEVSNSPTAEIREFTLSDEEKYRLLANASFYIATSTTEGFGLPVMESMVLGTPVIYPDCHAYHEYAMGIKVKCWKVREDWYEYDEKEYLEAVKYAFGMSDDEYVDLSYKVSEHAKRLFDPDVVVKRLLQTTNLHIES